MHSPPPLRHMFTVASSGLPPPLLALGYIACACNYFCTGETGRLFAQRGLFSTSTDSWRRRDINTPHNDAGKFWTTADVHRLARLLRIHDDFENVYAFFATERSRESVRHAARKFASEHYAKFIKIRGRKNRPFTVEEIAFIIQHYGPMSASQIAARLGRSRCSIISKYNNMTKERAKNVHGRREENTTAAHDGQ